MKRIETLRYVTGQAWYLKYSVFWAVTELWSRLSRLNARTGMSSNRWVSGFLRGTVVGGDWFSATRRK